MAVNCSRESRELLARARTLKRFHSDRNAKEPTLMPGQAHCSLCCHAANQASQARNPTDNKNAAQTRPTGCRYNAGQCSPTDKAQGSQFGTYPQNPTRIADLRGVWCFLARSRNTASPWQDDAGLESWPQLHGELNILMAIATRRASSSRRCWGSRMLSRLRQSPTPSIPEVTGSSLHNDSLVWARQRNHAELRRMLGAVPA